MSDAKKKDRKEKKEQTDTEALKEQVVRLSADLQNLRKAGAQAQKAASRLAIIAAVRAIVPAYDALLLAAKEAEGTLGQGIANVRKQLEQGINTLGVVRINTEGSYDPKFHEAVERVKGEEYRIMEEVSSGWMFRDDEQVIVAAKVKVGSGEPKD